jgi:hypothetical protein
MKKLTLTLTVAIALVAAIVSIAIASGEWRICYGKLVNGDIRNNPPIVNATGHIVEDATLYGTTNSSGDFIIYGVKNAGTYHVQFDGWTSPVAFYYNGTYQGTNVGTLVGHAQ